MTSLSIKHGNALSYTTAPLVLPPDQARDDSGPVLDLECYLLSGGVGGTNRLGDDVVAAAPADADAPKIGGRAAPVLEKLPTVSVPSALAAEIFNELGRQVKV